MDWTTNTSMKIGDLIFPIIPKNHQNPWIRIYDIPYAICVGPYSTWKFPAVVDKISSNDSSIIIEIDQNGKTKILTPKSILGWCDSRLLQK